MLLDTFENTQSACAGLRSVTPRCPRRSGPDRAAPTDVAAEEAQGALTPRAAAKLVSELVGIGGTAVYSFCPLPQAAEPDFQGQYLGGVSCQVMRDLAVLGQCGPGVAAVQVQDQGPALQRQPAQQHRGVRRREQPRLHRQPGRAAAAGGPGPGGQRGHAERVRAFLALHAPPQVSGGQGVAATPPRTYGEAVAIRSSRAHVLQRLVSLAVALTILVAGCSLAVAIGGGLANRNGRSACCGWAARRSGRCTGCCSSRPRCWPRPPCSPRPWPTASGC